MVHTAKLELWKIYNYRQHTRSSRGLLCFYHESQDNLIDEPKTQMECIESKLCALAVPRVSTRYVPREVQGSLGKKKQGKENIFFV